MLLGDFLRGVEVLRPFYNNPNGSHLAAEHDVIYLYPTDKPLGAEEVKELLLLGFFQEHRDNYDPKESWAVYV